jgi:hypothetical protein
MNVSSMRVVALSRHWCTDEMMVRLAVVLGGCKFETTLTCFEAVGRVSEINITV